MTKDQINKKLKNVNHNMQYIDQTQQQRRTSKD